MRTKKASLIISPRTGENVTKLPDVLAILSAAGWKTDISLKEYGGHVMELAHSASEDKKDLVIAYGGDGTLNQAVNGVMSSKRRSVIGIMPGGTANVWAGEIGVPIDPVKAALTLVNSEERKVDVGRIQVHSITFPGEEPIAIKGNIKKQATKDSQSVRHHFLLMAGMGIDAAIMNNVSKPLKYRIGALAVAESALKEIPAQRAFPIEIQALGKDSATEPLWKGEAMQVVIGNTRRYAKVAKLTPDAYIDDGILDLCVITAGDTLSTLQQISSLLLRLKPDNTTAEYFRGAHLLLKVPATVPLQVDGSPVKLKNYLSKSDYEKLLKLEDMGQAQITYQVDVLPHALEVAIPCTYNDELFEHTANEPYSDHGDALVKGDHHHFHKDDEQPETELQQHTTAVLSRPESELHHENSDLAEKQHEEMRKALPAFADALLQNGKKVRVVGKVPNPAQKDCYIVAGGIVQPLTGEVLPTALVVNRDTTIFDHDGKQLNNIHAAIENLLEGAEVVVEGKKSKHSVIHATRLVI